MLVRPTGTPDYLITIFRNAVPVWVGNQRLYIPSPCAMIWPPGEPQQFGMASPWSYSWLHAGGQFLHELMRQYGVPMLTPLPLPESAMVEGLLGMMQHELQVQIPHEHILTNAMEIFILSLMRENRTASDGTSRIPAVFTELKRYLDRHFAAPVTLASLADRSAMSTSAMRYGFKRYFGRPPIEYLIQVRMSHACELLQNHTLRISEVAAQVGYDDPNTFAIIFRRHFGISPRSYRASLRGDVFREQFLHETYTWELAKLLEEGWLPVTDSDFTSAPLLDTHWRCEQYLYDQAPFEITPCDPHFTTKGLEFPQQNRWTQLRWVTPCAEETKLECDIRNTSPDGLNLAFSLSGDLRTGYRLRLYGWHQADLETIAYGRGEVLHHGQMQLDPDASRYRVTLWRSGSTITAEINGQHILTYHDALPLHGPEHRTFAVGRGKGAGGACIHRLRVFMRREARYVDVLEPGRVLLRYGNHEESSAWFQQVATTYQEPSIVQEAEYLSALAMLAGNRADSDMALAAICADPSHLYRRQALREQALQYAKSGEIARAVAALREIATYPPTDDTIQQVLDRLFAHCRNSSDAPALATILPELASLPLTSLNLSKLGLTNLAMITGLSLTSLECSSNYLTSIASVRAMPLQQLYCGENCLTHLHPLQGMALHSLRCHDNQLTDLAPLAGMPLTSLSCWANAISDLTPLQGIPLRELACGHNTITDLSALREMPLEALSCDHNRITDLSPLHGSPTLRDVSCASNHLTSLEPLQGCALSSLTCGDNPIRDLSPLAGMPLEVLIATPAESAPASPLSQ